MKALIITVLYHLVLAEYTFENCYDCAAKGDRKLCDLDGFVTNAWTGACCTTDDISPDCEAGDSNVCSDTYVNSNHMFYSFCPLNNHTMCTDGTSMIFEAE